MKSLCPLKEEDSGSLQEARGKKLRTMKELKLALDPVRPPTNSAMGHIGLFCFSLRNLIASSWLSSSSLGFSGETRSRVIRMRFKFGYCQRNLSKFLNLHELHLSYKMEMILPASWIILNNCHHPASILSIV